MNSYNEHEKVIIIYSFIKKTTSSLHQEIKFTSCILNKKNDFRQNKKSFETEHMFELNE